MTTQSPVDTIEDNGHPVAPPRKSRSREIHHLPIADMMARDRMLLCELIRDNWHVLAEQMQMTRQAIMGIQRTAHQFMISPPETLLTVWGDQMNHNVTELFVLLARYDNYEAMLAIRHLVDPAYHQLIKPLSIGQNQEDILHTTDDNINIDGPPIQLPESAKILNRSLSSNEDNSAQSNSMEIEEHAHRPADMNEVLGQIPRISYAELQEATNNWSDQHILGAGGFGTVYHGVWKYTKVAIKRIKSQDTQSAKVQIQQSLNELRYLNACRHDNILPLYGYSMDDDVEPCLVYQLMQGGSLETKLLRAAHTLRWTKRMEIALGTARGLQFLHTFSTKPLIHGDIKPANILLDGCSFPKIGDFGLTREGNFDDAEIEVSRVYGTKPYLPREFLYERTLSTKVDTFSFGIVLLELATGLRAHSSKYGYLSQYVRSFNEQTESQLMDKSLEDTEMGRQTFKLLFRLGKRCSSQKHRPEMVEVLKELQNWT